MNEKDLQHLLSLSVLSLIGPRWDIEYLSGCGLYKKGSSETCDLVLNMGHTTEGFGPYENILKTFLQGLGIVDQETYTDRLKELIGGTVFSLHMDQMLQLGRGMNQQQRNQLGSIHIGTHPYARDLFNEVMSYEFHWPAEGLKAYDIANAVMLLRVGISLGYLDETQQSAYLEWLFMEVESLFMTYKAFGEAAVIGRNIHLKHLDIIGVETSLLDNEWILSMAYHSLWSPLKLVDV